MTEKRARPARSSSSTRSGESTLSSSSADKANRTVGRSLRIVFRTASVAGVGTGGCARRSDRPPRGLELPGDHMRGGSPQRRAAARERPSNRGHLYRHNPHHAPAPLGAQELALEALRTLTRPGRLEVRPGAAEETLDLIHRRTPHAPNRARPRSGAWRWPASTHTASATLPRATHPRGSAAPRPPAAAWAAGRARVELPNQHPLVGGGSGPDSAAHA